MKFSSENIKKGISLLVCISVFACIFAAAGIRNTSAAITPAFIYGDVNGDRTVDALDLSLLKMYLLGTITTFPSDQGKNAADVDMSGSVDSIDLSMIKKYLLGQGTLPDHDVEDPPVLEPITIPAFSSLQANAKLPDPFMYKTGLKKGTRITSKSQWEQRRYEISQLAQAYEYGVKPDKPESVTASYSSNKITITCKQGGKTISFACSIQYPTTGKAPYPAMIGVNMNNLNTSEILKLGVALITFPADEIAQQVDGSSRGKGKFFDLYGSTYDAGALIAWAWGVDRLIDALEITPAANIDPTKLGVTGGSRNGKGALAIGAFDERIALTIPQESGNGGASGWRTADAQKAAGQNVQTLSQIVGENVWFAKALNQFVNNTTKLPYDHHEIEALCAPRGLLIIENPDFEWLGNQSCWNTATAGRMIYQALGVQDNMGYSSIGGHGHCVLPASQQPEVTAFIQKFLLGQNVSTNVFRSDKTYTFDKARWIDWTVPNLQ
ncbi:dockerin type I repeat-containing protein [Ruminiclostridium josui]|uniref:dockerin type I repeat-containing protein n=1 Tax=Ruminiclostridium josui TaxID=1499 RepID=UPI0004B76D18|nr:dockerin type I repeat-containing protein [Ruminiclostridium josui]